MRHKILCILCKKSMADNGELCYNIHIKCTDETEVYMDTNDNAEKNAAQDNINEEKSAVYEHWRRRLSALSESEQVRISKKYYGGAMPWKKA